ncbi:hypothetical protein MVEG_09330 [Podila verticillata NRRL 6337]|nr:hypothetical protein MVEG_09330 [Podila verticillata NRRL 6337]
MPPTPFHILIVGAGVSGLFLAFLLEHAHVNYTVIERQSEADYNLKGILQMTATSMGVIDQLGLLPEYMALAKVSRAVSLYKSDMQLVGHFPTTDHERHFGYPCTAITRMAFCRLLLSKIPKEKIRWKQHITEIVHGDSGVSVHCTDGSSITSQPNSSSSPSKAKRFGRNSAEGMDDLRDLGLHPPTSSSSQLARYRSISTNQYYGPNYNSHVRYRASSKTKPWSPLRRVRHDGDILIGADGAYSQVRQSLYDRMAVVRRKMDLELAMNKAKRQHKSPDLPLCHHQHRHQNRLSRMQCANGASEHTAGSAPSKSAPSSSSDSDAPSLYSSFETLATPSVLSSFSSDSPQWKPGMLRRSRSLGELCGGQTPIAPPRTSSRPEVFKADRLPLRVTEIAVVGITENLSHDLFPEAASRFADIKLVGDKDCNYSIFIMSLGNNSVGWSILGPVTHSGKVLDGNFGQSEWSVEMAEILMSRCRDIKSPYGGVLGDLFDRTPKSTICKYMIEEKLFSTWYYSRTCLMGDGEFLYLSCSRVSSHVGF